jgi:predicted metal-dependent peptidase
MEALDIIAATQLWLNRKFEYLAHATMSLRPVVEPGLGTMGIDEQWHLAFDPEAVLRWGARHCRAPLMHEDFHPLLDHFRRQSNRDPKVWNWAGDVFINQILEDTGEVEWPPGFVPLTIKLLDLPPKLSEEEYYEILIKRKRQGGGQGLPEPGAGKVDGFTMPGAGSPCGRGAGNDQGWEDKIAEAAKAGEAPEGGTEADSVLIRRIVAEQVRAAKASGRGTMPLGLDVWSSTVLDPPEIPWTQKLATRARYAIASTTGANDYDRGRVSRRYLGMRAAFGPRTPITPALRAPKPQAAVVVDSSGSMLGEPLCAAWRETMGVVRAIGLPTMVIVTDAAVQALKKVSLPADLAEIAKGGGGTDMTVGIARAAEEKVDVIIVLTDGQTPWPSPEEMPRAKLIAAIIGDTGAPDHIEPLVIRVPLPKKKEK